MSIIHPKNQIEIIDFYENYRDIILYYSNISQYSIRKPSKVAKYIYQKAKNKKREFGKDEVVRTSGYPGRTDAIRVQMDRDAQFGKVNKVAKRWVGLKMRSNGEPTTRVVDVKNRKGVTITLIRGE